MPHHVLNRGGSLTDQESKLVEKYVQESVAACRRMGYVDPHLLEIVLHHHEAWDGTGYPDGLRGEDIPLGARITPLPKPTARSPRGGPIMRRGIRAWRSARFAKGWKRVDMIPRLPRPSSRCFDPQAFPPKRRIVL